MIKKEIRGSNFQLSANEESRLVEGYAIVFNTESRDLGGFTETIHPEAIEGVLEKSDILALLNHSQERGILARSKYGTGSLELTVDSTGLKYRFEAPKTSLGDELVEGLKRGDITTSSFAFTIESDNWTKKEDGTYLRTITKFKELYDISPVYKEAYPDTSVALRRLEESEAQKELEEQEDLSEYYQTLRNKIQ